MLALFRIDNNGVELRECGDPSIKSAYDVLIAVRSAAVCTTDLAIVSGAFGGTTPRIIGHEVAGEVLDVGAAATCLSAGDRVTLQPTIACGECPSCKQGHWHLCPNRQFVGLDVDGGLAERMVVPEANLVPVPDDVPSRHACMVEPLACVVHAVDCLEKLPEKGVVISGAGVSAFLFVQILVGKGVEPGRILVSGRRDKRLAIARELGARVVDVRTESLAKAAGEAFGEDGPDLFVDQTGDPALLRESMDILARKGTLFIYDFTGSDIPFNFGAMQLREITVKTSTGCPETMAPALALMKTSVDVSAAITHTYPPARMDEAFSMLQNKDPSHVKSVVEFGGD